MPDPEEEVDEVDDRLRLALAPLLLRDDFLIEECFVEDEDEDVDASLVVERTSILFFGLGLAGRSTDLLEVVARDGEGACRVLGTEGVERGALGRGLLPPEAEEMESIPA